MTSRASKLSGVLVAVMAGLAGSSTSAIGADAAHPAVLELFQSQGCSSCPPANANVMALSGRPDILALSFEVTYWDNLGWKDTFDQPKFTARQYDYAKGLGHPNVFTPQVVVNGRRDGVGVDPRALRGLLAAADRGDGGPMVSIGRRTVRISAGAAGKGADVWLVRYDPRIIQVSIKRGENGGKTLPHKNIVRELTWLGRRTGPPLTLPISPPADEAWKTAVLVQNPGGGAILAAATG
ncbi:MAG TPA: DUF1223 domain-containing protein [Caulobacteraceae bacterium]